VRLVGGQLDDAVPEPDVFRALRGGSQEDLRRGGMGVFLQEVVLNFPGEVITELVGELDLGEAVLKKIELAGLGPWARELVLVKDAELHDGVSSVSLPRTVAPGG
jgi:hypothetical protein